MKKLLVLLITAFIITSFAPKKTTWVAIGDSITFLNEHARDKGSKITKGYMTGVVEKLQHIHYFSQGYNGTTSRNVARKIDSLGFQKADVCSIFLGTNDWWQGHPVGTLSDYENNTGANTVYGAFRIIINKLRLLNKDAAIILITPMQRVDFVYNNNMTNNAYGSYKEKNGQSLEQFAEAVLTIGDYEKFTVVDLYHNKRLSLPHLVKYKRLKDPATSEYKKYPYPDFIGIPFNPATDEYPYPSDAIDITYDGLHPSDKGYAIISKILVKVLKQF